MVVDVVRGGPGLGNIAPEQSDYFAVVKGGGHGNYKNLVLAPASVQEMADLTMLAFELADRYRNPAVVLTDGFVGQMMEPLELQVTEAAHSGKAVGGKRHGRDTQESDSSIFLEPDELEAHVRSWRRSTSWQRRWSTRYETVQRGRCRQFCWWDMASCRACCATWWMRRGNKECARGCSARFRCGRSRRRR